MTHVRNVKYTFFSFLKSGVDWKLGSQTRITRSGLVRAESRTDKDFKLERFYHHACPHLLRTSGNISGCVQRRSRDLITRLEECESYLYTSGNFLVVPIASWCLLPLARAWLRKPKGSLITRTVIILVNVILVCTTHYWNFLVGGIFSRLLYLLLAYVELEFHVK